MQASSPFFLPDPDQPLTAAEEFVRACEAPASQTAPPRLRISRPATASRLDALVHVIRAVTSAADQGAGIEAAARIGLERLCLYLGWPVGHLYVVSEADPNVLVSSGVWHLEDPDRFQAFRDATEETPCRAGAAFPAGALAGGRAAWVPDVTFDPGFARTAAATRTRLRGGFAMPILIGAEPVGVLELFSPNAAEPDALLTDLAPSIGAQLGRACAQSRAQNGRKSHEEAAPAARAPLDAAWSWNLRTGSVCFSPEWAAMAGSAELAPRLSEWLSRLHPDDAAGVCSALEAHISGNTPELEVEYRLRHSDGGYRKMRTRARAVRDAAGRAFRLSGVQTDLSAEPPDEGVARERRGDKRPADEPVALAGRSLLVDRLKGAMARAGRRGGGSLAVLSVSLDRWERINERLGHEAGERMLLTAARRIAAGMRGGDTVARTNGDGFAVLLEEIESQTEAVAVAERIHRELEQPFDLAGSPAVATASIGIALGSPDYERPEDLLKDAAAAMRVARNQGGACHEIFKPSMRDGGSWASVASPPRIDPA